ncbi:MAG TPA: polyribonucleotide nucleotidyltransferase [Phycisphaerae bacterium]|nr:polyribonucleotide nucleotidyltransferase [Phycisphaerae bacterium]
MKKYTSECKIGGKTLTLESGWLAKQAAGTVMVTYGETVVMVAVVTSDPRPGIDFFPLTCDYREKAYAAGKFPGGFFKRESRPTTKEILTMRLMDRPIRPLFPKGFINEVMIQAMVLATDQEHDPDMLAMIGASAALSISEIPFEGPTGAVRVGRVDGKFVVMPTLEQMDQSDMELVVSGHSEAVNMIELGGFEIAEPDVVSAVEVAHKEIRTICDCVNDLVKQCGKEKNWTPPPSTDGLKDRLREKVAGPLRKAKEIASKQDRYEAVKNIYNETLDQECPDGAENLEFDRNTVRNVIDEIEGEVVAAMVLDTGIRADGRGLTDIRPLTCEVGVLPRTHGSAVFTRGETQSMAVVTLGTVRDEQFIDGLMPEYSKKFMLHYNFPPFCVGEVRRLGAVSRREIGHGNLAEKAIEMVLPSPEDFPYTVRVVSEILESNGSSSMASVCGGTLALMDAGVPLTQPVAGISVGGFHDDKRRKLIVDILGEEDHFGDMDFKVAGTQRGITAIQVDLKDRSLSIDIVKEALEIAKGARLEILAKMLETLPEPRSETSKYAPRILSIKINPDRIGKVIGPGGKGIKAIEAGTGAKVEIDDDGTITISCMDLAGAESARSMIEAVTESIKVGTVYSGTVTSVKDFGAFVEIAPGQDGLCHVSELSTDYVRNVADVCKVGDPLKVKVIAVDNQGRIKLSHKAVQLEEKQETADSAS